MGAPARRVVAFLFVDMEGSTRLLRELGSTYSEVLTAYRHEVETAVEAAGGTTIDTQGDGHFAGFPTASGAVDAAVAAQRGLEGRQWPADIEVRARMGLHIGEVLEAPAGYVGLDVHRAARIAAASHGGQVLVSQSMAELVRDELPEGVQLRELGLHRFKDLPRPEVVFQLDVDGLETEFPAIKSLESGTQNLPASLSQTVGRDAEMAALGAALEDSRLLTITGVGGVGKTTTALGLARLKVDAFPHGVWWFELAALRDPELIATEMMGALRVPPRADVPHLDTVCAALSDRTALLVIDNCEHLIAEVARIAEVILRRCPGVKLLATSREPLAVPGEVAWRLPTLSLPESTASAAEALDADATRLFQLRAREADRGFEVNDANAASIASICRRLDGLPFAIELAAARLRSMGLTELEDRLDDRFRVLTGGSRTEVPHHQTLRGTVEWSYDLLAPEEQRLYRLLSVFRGGFGVDAAEAVYGADGALDLVDALVAQSLVIADRGDERTRYRMLETIREHGHDLLASADETEAARTAHMEYVAALVNEGARRLEGRESTKWMHRFRMETDNIRAALAHAVVADPATGAAVCSGLSRFWWRHATEGDVTTLDDATSFLQEGRRWSEKMLQAAGRELPEKTRASLLMAMGGLLDIRLGYYDDAIARLEEAEALWTAIGNVRNRGWSVFYQGIASWGKIAVDETIGFFDRSVALHEEAEDPFGAGMSKILRALALARAGQFDRGTPDLEAFERLAEETGNPFMIAHAEDARAVWAIGLGEATAADRRRIIDAIRHFQTIGNYACLGHGIHTAAMLLAQEGRPEEAACCLGIVTAIRDRLGMVVAPYEDRTMWVEELGVDTLDEATRNRAESAGRSMEPETGIEWVIATLSPTSGSTVM